MSKILKIPSEKSIKDPKVILTIDLIDGSVNQELTEECNNCSGYGSPCSNCERGTISHIVKNKKEIDNWIGASGKEKLIYILEDYLNYLSS